MSAEQHAADNRLDRVRRTSYVADRQPGDVTDLPSRAPAQAALGQQASLTLLEQLHEHICKLAASANLSVERIEGAAARALGPNVSKDAAGPVNTTGVADGECASNVLTDDLAYLGSIVSRLEAAADRIERIV